MPQPVTTREASTRAALEEPKDYVYRPSALLPEVREDSEYSYLWARKGIGKDIDTKNMNRKLQDGFEPVPYDERSTTLVRPNQIMGKPESGHIESGELVLMRRPKYMTIARNKYFEKQTAERLAGAGTLQQGFKADPSKAKFVERVFSLGEHTRGQDRSFGE